MSADGEPQLMPLPRRQITVYWTEWAGELAIHLTPEDQGADLKDGLCNYSTGRLEEYQKADLYEVDDDKVADWLAEHVEEEIDGVYWGESIVLLPDGWVLRRKDEGT